MMPDLDEIHDRYICNLVEIYVLLCTSRRDYHIILLLYHYNTLKYYKNITYYKVLWVFWAFAGGGGLTNCASYAKLP
jgi:hypothetical protein